MSIHGFLFLVSCVFFRYIKFDTFTPAAEKGLPVTRVISRMTLQQILAKAVGPEIIENSSNVIDFGDDGTTVCVQILTFNYSLHHHHRNHHCLKLS